MDRATKAVMDYDEAVAAVNGGRNSGKKTERPSAPAATTVAPAADSGYSGAAVWRPGGSLVYPLSLLVCALLRRFSD